MIDEVTKRKKHSIEGYFILSDKSKTKFSIDDVYGWSQWGNSDFNLYLTVPRVEALLNELLDL